MGRAAGYRCEGCGEGSATWVGRCPGCGAWNRMVQHRGSRSGRTPAVAPAPPLQAVALDDEAVHPTGVAELDRVLGGGLVPGSVTLVGGEPGIGKSTLVLQASAALASAGRRVLLVSAEESAAQVRLRAERLRALAPSLHVVAEWEMPVLRAHVDALDPHVVVVDSIQTVAQPDITSAPGSTAQVQACAGALVRQAKERALTTVLVGHVTKDGTLAGPRALEHLVDTVLAFEGDRHQTLRVLRAVKHRFGSTTQLGVLEMAGRGLRGVPDASGLLLADRLPGVAGSVVAPVLVGQRPLLVEIQALVGRTALPHARRSAQGLDPNRLALVLAVVEQRAGVRLSGHDVYASAVGGVRVAEPGADLALALAVASAAADRPVPPDVVACGEVGLGGELRQAPGAGRRLAEAARLGFRAAIVPASTPDAGGALRLLRATTLAEAITQGWRSAVVAVGARSPGSRAASD